MSDSQFWIILIVILTVGGLLYLASGFIYVHKGYMAVIEKDGKFYAVKPRGLYFFYQCVLEGLVCIKLENTKILPL